MGRRWTRDEELRLEQLSWKYKFTEIARMMGRSQTSIQGHVEAMRNQGRWSGRYRRRESTPEKEIKEIYLGCERNCEACPYSDCIAPDRVCRQGLNIVEYIFHPYERRNAK